jgi:hypothetical protein
LISDNKKEKKEKKKVDGGKTEVEKKGSGPNSMTLVYQSRNPSFKTCHNDIISNFGKATNLQKIERIIEPIASYIALI